MTGQPQLENGPVGLLLSGGLDSAVLLVHLLEQGHAVQPFYVRCGLAWEAEEQRAVERLLAAVRSSRVAPLVTFDMPLHDLYGSHWSLTGRDVPAAGTADEAVYLPARNPLLLIKPLVWCHQRGIRRLALGTLRSNPFADAQEDFLVQFGRAIGRAVSGHDAEGRPGLPHVEIVRPLAQYTKHQILQLAGAAPLEWTFSCAAPAGGLHCGECNKCEERQRAFALAGRPDPTTYAVPPAATRVGDCSAHDIPQSRASRGHEPPTPPR